MTLKYQMIMEKYPNQTEWLVVRFPVVKSSLYLTETSPVVQKHLLCSNFYLFLIKKIKNL